jgi:hypothetical protein
MLKVTITQFLDKTGLWIVASFLIQAGIGALFAGIIAFVVTPMIEEIIKWREKE